MKSFTLTLFIGLVFTLSAQGQSRVQPGFQEGVVKLIKFYPNPATSIINFELQKDNSDKSFSFQIYNFIGKKVYESQNITQKTQINLTDFNMGVYIFQLKDRTGKVLESGKFQVSK
jgi:hypothetical protein